MAGPSPHQLLQGTPERWPRLGRAPEPVAEPGVPAEAGGCAAGPEPSLPQDQPAAPPMRERRDAPPLNPCRTALGALAIALILAAVVLAAVMALQ